MVFGWFKKKAPAPEPAYLGLRDQVLSIRPAEIQLSKSAEMPDVWGVLMETGYPDATVTLVALGEGTTSLYFSTGGGIIGAGEHEPVAQATAELISRSQKFCRKMQPTNEFPLPAVGCVRFYLLTFSGVRTVEAIEEEVGIEKHLLFPLYCLAQDVITNIRICTE